MFVFDLNSYRIRVIISSFPLQPRHVLCGIFIKKLLRTHTPTYAHMKYCLAFVIFFLYIYHFHIFFYLYRCLSFLPILSTMHKVWVCDLWSFEQISMAIVLYSSLYSLVFSQKHKKNLREVKWNIFGKNIEKVCVWAHMWLLCVYWKQVPSSDNDLWSDKKSFKNSIYSLSRWY